jgi:CheY-like chemotaxis protein
MVERQRLLMIVEDDLATRDALGGLCSRYGWGVCLSPTVTEALNLLEHGLEPDCLVLDLVLPDGDGIEVLRKVREAGLRTHITVCTGDTDPIRLIQVRQLNPELLLIKPIDPEVVCHLCADAVGPF